MISNVVFYFCFSLIGRRRRRRTFNTFPFPPGPKALPLIGNLHQLPLKKPFLYFAQLSKIYSSPIIGLRFGRQPVVVLNTWRAVHDLFDQRGAIYSSRPYIPMVDYVVPGPYHVAFMPHGRNWRRGRAALVSFLKDEELEKILPIQQAESTQMVFEILKEPKGFEKHVLRAFCAVIMESVYGVRGTRELTDRFFEIQDEWAGILDMGAMPPLSVLPWLKYVPSVLTPWPGWRKRSANVGEAQRGFYQELFEQGKKNICEGKAKESFLANLLKRKEKEGFTDIELVYIAGFLIEAGADTTAVASLIFILAMAANPHVQKRGQEEIDRAFGDKLPANIDAPQLPYLQAILWEVLRWRPSFPLSIPHATSKDDIYEGYFIPADATVLMNTWAIHHNEEDYPNADVFDPARWLVDDSSSTLHGHSADSVFLSTDEASRRRTYAFGAGRRVCAGQEMAERSLLLSMAKLLWAFDMRPEAGTVLDTNVETGFKDAVLTGPKDCKIDFKIRSDPREVAIGKGWERASTILSKFG
ncbi:uncharacterized protein N0V89_008451 [Didymosphaeria variabile]|uniref:Cytochrome P450 n=1 Tax=Didymosphaeria variabile TaxID=1932322 RepID=A0A9W8XHL1_9PLEO|nr:uncharacterized protein N0V89_008451 [Didymosphaeria variabile]KAJ4349832.1 hypothetical protein N0V89_008451 [Didymosphaeria variabile]